MAPYKPRNGITKMCKRMAKVKFVISVILFIAGLFVSASSSMNYFFIGSFGFLCASMTIFVLGTFIGLLDDTTEKSSTKIY
ncbi:hypothetical protein [Priestia koreensis]|uniref:Uncharacterized protein n=1 Tax=Priestia koreensis TaxID=284581 RepID=A0A0M0LBP8_9BACI|nr:hypothetical protein [Priestia koreensis]KOO48500.1 hypothetical protein AMD01_04540 [Priestia koreensis]MCM3004427.1 hypothetical protein [Priestia koreensis]UNL84640.1 hypothetical protein IE339_21460 [Priestia koreensis]